MAETQNVVPEKKTSKMTTLPRFLHIFDTHHSGNMLCPKIRGLVFVNTPTFFTHFGWSVAVVPENDFVPENVPEKSSTSFLSTLPRFLHIFGGQGSVVPENLFWGHFGPRRTERAYRRMAPRGHTES